MLRRTVAAELGVFALLAVIAPACPQDPANQGGGPDAEVRHFRMGFTDFPDDLTTQGIISAAAIIRAEGDLSVQHFDDGIPWNAALTGAPYPATYTDELDGHASLIPSGHRVFLAITPISVTRDGLAANRTNDANQPLPAPWDGYAFDHPDVARAFLNHCLRMLDRFHADYVAFAIEVNLLLENRPDQWDALVRLLTQTYTDLKAARPTLPVFVTLFAEAFHRDVPRQREALAALLPFTDYIAVSSYPYLSQSNLENGIPSDYFAALADLAPSKPFAVSETGWPAEDLTAPSPVVVRSDPAAQRSYVERILSEGDARNAEFITWFLTRDFDTAWETVYEGSASAPTARFFRDLGLFDGAGMARPGLTTWRQTFAREYVPRAAAIVPTLRPGPPAQAEAPRPLGSNLPAAPPGAPALEPIEARETVHTTRDGVGFRVQVLMAGLERVSSMAFSPDGRLFVAERPGRVRIFTLGSPAGAPALRLDDLAAPDGSGLQGLALDPAFARTRFVYLSYTARLGDGGAAGRVVRYREVAGRLIEGVGLLDGIPASPSSPFRSGGRIRFGPDGRLYVATGDARQAPLAQDLASLAGKFLRLDGDGRTPRDNRFASPVHSFGHRDPQGFDWQPATGTLWAFEHGPDGTDELNAIAAGADYGWPGAASGRAAPGTQAPARLYAPGLSPEGASFYRGAPFPSFDGRLFAAGARGLLLVAFDRTRPGRVASEELLLEGLGHLTDVIVGPDGFLYVSTGDRVLRLVPASQA
jgi:glucose/arabinose dehydrogenase